MFSLLVKFNLHFIIFSATFVVGLTTLLRRNPDEIIPGFDPVRNNFNLTIVFGGFRMSSKDLKDRIVVGIVYGFVESAIVLIFSK